MTTEGTQRKRGAGEVTEDGEWWVVIESEKREDGGYTHKCGVDILEKKFVLSSRIIAGKRIALPLRYTEIGRRGKPESITVLYCPNCEEEPTIDKIISGDFLIHFFEGKIEDE